MPKGSHASKTHAARPQEGPHENGKAEAAAGRKPRIVVNGLSKDGSLDRLSTTIGKTLRAAGVSKAGEDVTIDLHRGTITLRLDTPDRWTASLELAGPTVTYRDVADVRAVAKDISRSLARGALLLVCWRMTRGDWDAGMPPAWACHTRPDLVRAVRHSGGTLLKLHAAIAGQWAKRAGLMKHDVGKWHVGADKGANVERRGMSGGLPTWDGMTGTVERPDVRTQAVAQIKLGSIDLGSRAYYRSAHPYCKITIPRELHDDDVRRLGAGEGIPLYVDHPFTRTKRFEINSVNRSAKTTTIILKDPRDYQSVRVAPVPVEITAQANALRMAIEKAGAIDPQRMTPYDIGIDEQDVPEEAVAVPAPPAPLQPSLLAETIKRAFLRQMAKGDAEPWENIARDVTDLLTRHGVPLSGDMTAKRITS